MNAFQRVSDIVNMIAGDIEYAREMAYELFDGDFTVKVEVYGEEEEE